MRGRTRVVLAAAVTALALVIAVAILDEEERVDPYLTFVTAHLDILPTEPLPVSSDAKFSRTIAKFTVLENVDPALDACAGPVAVYLGAGIPSSSPSTTTAAAPTGCRSSTRTTSSS